MKRRILFVDPKVQDSRRLLFAMAELEPDWEFRHAETGRAALAQLAGEEFDAVVSELALPDVDGNRILSEALQHQPRALRLALSDMSDRDMLLKGLGTAHQYLVRPCDAEALDAALCRAFSLDLWLPNEKVVRLLGEMTKLPSPPALYFQVVRQLRSESASLDDIGALIARDPAMTAKILRAVNSAVFGLGKQVASPTEAVLYLGAESTKSLILLAHTYSYFDQMPGIGLTMDELWRHSLATGACARWIATEEGLSESLREEAYTAGMLHDIGKLILAANLTDRYRRAAQLIHPPERVCWEAEEAVFGVNHAEVGACLATVWGLPVGIVEAIALHHHPTLVVSAGVCPLTLVHAANAIEHAVRGSTGDGPPAVDTAYLGRLELADRLPDWLALCRSRGHAEEGRGG